MSKIKYVVTRDVSDGGWELVRICRNKQDALSALDIFPDCQARNERGHHVTREELESKPYKPENWSGVVWFFWNLLVVVIALNLIKFVYDSIGTESIWSIAITTLLAFCIYWAGMFDAHKNRRF